MLYAKVSYKPFFIIFILSHFEIFTLYLIFIYEAVLTTGCIYRRAVLTTVFVAPERIYYNNWVLYNGVLSYLLYDRENCSVTFESVVYSVVLNDLEMGPSKKTISSFSLLTDLDQCARSLRKLCVRKFPVTCGRTEVLLSLKYSEVFLHQ